MARFKVVERERIRDAKPQYAVVDSENRDMPVAHFSSRREAEAHVEKLESGPFDWDEQEAWQDDDWGEPRKGRS